MSLADCKVEHICSDDIDELVCLHELYLNYGDGIRPHFEEILRDSDSVALKYMINDEMAGLFIYTKGIALSGNHSETEACIEKLSEGKSVYTGDAVLVKKEYRCLGVARKLCAAMIKELRRRGAELAVHEFWVHPNGHIPAQRMFRVFTKNIFIGRYEQFYRDFHHFGYLCPICGKECVCAAEIYLAEIPEVLV
jgi:GNAT superfamily N-acetyltransferase